MFAKLRIKHYTPIDLTGFIRLLTDNGYRVEIERNNTVTTGIVITKNGDDGHYYHALTEGNITELRDRFGEYVEFIVRDMVSGKGKRWESETD